MNNKFSTDLGAYLLVSHGSRDRTYQIAVERLASSIRNQLETATISKKYVDRSAKTSTALLSRPQSPIVFTAQLELTEIPLHQNILKLASKLEKLGVKRLQILPLFLLPGIHVKEDIPAEIAKARRRLGNSIALELLPYLGSNPSLIEPIETQFTKLPSSERILISHGSRRQGGNRPCEEIALKLGANAAYCAIAPSWQETVMKIAAKGAKKIAIVPYFLFAGKIFKSIAKQAREIEAEYPHLQLCLGQPLADTRELASSIARTLK